MYLHIGGDKVVKSGDIIGIFDIETASTSKTAREYLCASESKKIISTTDDLPKSFVVCRKRLKNGKNDKNTIVYISQISSSTLKKRIHTGYSAELYYKSGCVDEDI